MDSYFGYGSMIKDPILSPAISVLSTDNSRMFCNICEEIADRGLRIPQNKQYLAPMSFIHTKLKGTGKEQLEFKRDFKALCDKFKVYPSASYYTISTSFSFRKNAHYFLRKNMKSKYLLTGGPDEEVLYTLIGFIELQLANICEKLENFDNFTEDIKLCIEEIESTINMLNFTEIKNNKYMKVMLDDIMPTTSPFFHTLDNYFGVSHNDRSRELVDRGLMYLPDTEKYRIVKNFNTNKTSDINTLKINMRQYIEFIRAYFRMFNMLGCVDLNPVVDCYEIRYNYIQTKEKKVESVNKIDIKKSMTIMYAVVIIVIVIAYILKN